MSSTGPATAPGPDPELARYAAEQEQTASLLRRELAAMEDDLRSLERHVGHLEHGRLVLEIEIEQLRTRAAELFTDLERDEAEIAELRRALATGPSCEPSAPGDRVGSPGRRRRRG